MQLVWKIRTWVYVIAICVFALSACCKKENSTGLCNERLAFWPADIVPHPHLPNPEPSPTDPNADPDDPKNWA